MKKLKNKIGATLAELLIVIAIIGVLAGVTFIFVNQHQRSLGLLDRDAVAKELFVTAQNHLTVAYGAGYYGLTDDDAFGIKDTTTKKDDTDIQDDCYFVYLGTTDENSVLTQMLPFGSIDETVRAGGGYIIHYQKSTGLVLDVFYWTRSGTPDKFNYKGGVNETIYNNLMDEYRGVNNRKRLHWIDNSIVGWYGSDALALMPLPENLLNKPIIDFRNEEKLYVLVKDTNPGNGVLKLIVTGESSGAKLALDLRQTVSNVKTYQDTSNPSNPSWNYVVILDDVTTSGMQFKDLNSITDSYVTKSGVFIPGEDVTVQAIAFSTSALANTATSDTYTKNSLFETVSNTGTTTAYIGNIRHLENLDNNFSGLNTTSIKIKKAEQTKNFSWTGFQNNICEIEKKENNTPIARTKSEDIAAIGAVTGCYKPIAPNYLDEDLKLEYDGKNHSISDVKAEIDYAGLFGSVPTSKVSSISNLELIDFTIKGTNSAGSLAGTLDGTKVTNVLARGSSSTVTATSGAAGGLIGNMVGGSVDYSAASLIVNGGTAAGGLIGKTTATTTVTGCYSGGHTDKASYYSNGLAEYNEGGYLTSGFFNVSGTIAGGLIGNSGGASISNSYSTCSVSGSGTTAGGFLGIGGGTVRNCYCTGLVSPEKVTVTDTTTTLNTDTIINNAFYGNTDISGSSNYIYGIINEVHLMDNGKLKEIAYKGDNSPKVGKFDDTASSYDIFISCCVDKDHLWTGVKPAVPYDNTLAKYYSNNYFLRSVPQLCAELDASGKVKNTVPTDYFVNTHYGDWPAPEIFIINSK